MSTLQTLTCGRCHLHHDPKAIQGVCRECQGPLLARYDLSLHTVSLDEVLSRTPGQWRCFETQPTTAGPGTMTLGEGATPLVSTRRFGESLGLTGLLIKDEAQNPTLSFKARGMACAMARAHELGIRQVGLPSAGNAGGAAAAYGAAFGIEVVVAIPEATPRAIVLECEAHGATVHRVPGTIADAGAALPQFMGPDGFSLATLKEPYRIEGKKVMGYELLYDLGRLPDVIIYPTGGGTGLIGMWKAFQEMEQMGWIGPERPRMVVVQTEACAPMVRAFHQGDATATPWENPGETEAYGLRVPGALGDFLILNALRESGGTAVAVSETQMLEDTALLAKGMGMHAAAEGGACLAATRELAQSGWIKSDEQVVLFNTGHAMKYL